MNRFGFGLNQDFHDALLQQIAYVSGKLERGQAKTHEEYLALCAEIRAYRRALDIFDDILKRYLESEEDGE